MKENKVLIVIPARLASTRLPNKPLADIFGKTMIERVYLQATKAGIEQAKMGKAKMGKAKMGKAKMGKVYVACDGAEIASAISKVGGSVVITDPNLPSGTDRVYAALRQIDIKDEFDIIVNLQGDLPAIDPKVIQAAINALINSDADIATVASVIKNESEITNPNVVKIAIAFEETFEGKNDGDKKGHALYFSRSAIPYGSNQYYHHIGIYAYKKSALKKFVSLAPSKLEKTESLEQLRALENKMKIVVQIVDSHPLSVDTKEDLELIKKFIDETGEK